MSFMSMLSISNCEKLCFYVEFLTYMNPPIDFFFVIYKL
jgi:hypothetical protein